MLKPFAVKPSHFFLQKKMPVSLCTVHSEIVTSCSIMIFLKDQGTIIVVHHFHILVYITHTYPELQTSRGIEDI